MPKLPFRLRDLSAALVWVLAACVLSFLWTVKVAVWTAGWGAFLGYWVGVGLASTRVRVWAVLAGLAVLCTMGSLAGSIFTSNSFLAGMLGAENSYQAGQVFAWFVQVACGVGSLRFLSGRYPSLVSLEVLTVGLMLASPLAAHRQGYINRPYFLVDPLWSQNQDPVPFLFAIGAVCAAVMVVLAIGRGTRRAGILDLLILLAMIAVLYWNLPENRLKDWIPENKGAMGLKGDPKKPAKGSRGQGKSNEDQDDMPMDKPPPPPDPVPVAVVLLRDDYDPPSGYYYFRQKAFSQFNGKRLVSDTTGLADTDLIDHYPAGPTELKLSPRNPGYFQKLRTTVALIDSHPTPFGLIDPHKLEPIENPDPSQFVRAYDVESQALLADYARLFPLSVGNPQWSDKVKQHYLELPADPRYGELARKIAADIKRPEARDLPIAKALAIKLYLDRTVTYTFKADHSGYDDMVAHYLFEDPRGYCVHQAHAAVYLMRALGLPSRVGAGYATDARNRAGGSSILLRSAEAHAWPELYVEGVGWVTFDISPEKSDVPMMAPPDPSLQRMLGQTARKKEKKDPDEKQSQSIRELIRALLAWLWSWGKWSLLLGFVGLYVIKFYYRFEPLFCKDGRLGIAALRSAMMQMGEVGETRGYGEGRLEYARRKQEEYPALEPLTEWHLASTMGRHQAPAKQLLQLREQLHRQIATKHPAWRRLLGFLDPFSWLRIR